MSRRISTTDARDKLAELVPAMEQGQRTELTRDSRPVAALAPLQEDRISASSPRDLWSAIQEFRQTHDLSDLDIEDVYAGIRDPSPGRVRDEE
jgi:antitoxin (DNA-binding transcriptional repressor) of toxin-antitoxin stability system